MNSIFSTRNALCGLVAGLLGLTAPSKADTITLNGGGVTKLEVGASDRNGNHVATQGAPHSQAAYPLGLDAMNISSSGARDSSLDSSAGLFFSVSIDTLNITSGALSVDDPGLSAKFASLNTIVTYLIASGVLFRNNQASFGVIDLSLVLGGTAGTSENELFGSLVGRLFAGHQYRLGYGTSIYAANERVPAFFDGTFDMKFHPSPNTRPSYCCSAPA